MIPIPAEWATRLQCLVGSPSTLANACAPVFAPVRVDFLAELSSRLLDDPQAKVLPDVVTFAFWCRRANLQRAASAWQDGRLRVGLGLVFHVTPSNVPINFAYSLAFAFLAGNSSAMRLSEKPSPQVDLVVDHLARLLAEPAFAALRNSLLVMRYAKDDALTAFWLHHSLGRVIWGGDATVAAMRALGAHPRSRELAFVDRYSLSALRAQAVATLDERALERLCEALYNDLLLMGQRACSSPQLLAWVGDATDIATARSRLWPRFCALLDRRQELPAIRAMDKFVALCEELIAFDNIAQVTRHGNRLYRIELSHLGPQQQAQRGADGVVHEYAAASLDALCPIIDSRVQTLSQFGFAADELRQLVLEHQLTGIDRIVPVGKALEMGLLWDGQEAIASLSRLIDTP